MKWSNLDFMKMNIISFIFQLIFSRFYFWFELFHTFSLNSKLNLKQKFSKKNYKSNTLYSIFDEV